MVLTRKRRAIEAQNAVTSTADSLSDASLIASGLVTSGLPRAQHPDALLALPFDILLEVLNQVKPRDLLILSRLNKAWRMTMRGGNVNSRAVWTTKRKESKIPEPPTGVTEPQWASLWFETFCQSCCICRGSIDWDLFKRICGGCKTKYFVSRSQYMRRAEEFAEYLNYVPCVRRGNTDNYWEEDVQKVAKLFSDLDLSCLTTWKRKRTVALQERAANKNELKRAYESWKTETARVEKAERLQRRIEENVRALERSRVAFKEMGYEDVDVDPVMTADNPQIASYINSFSVTTYYVSDYRRRFEGQIQRQRDARLLREMVPLMSERMQVFQGWYYSMAVPTIFQPIDQILCPQPEEFRRKEQLQTLLESNKEAVVKAEDFAGGILLSLPGWIQTHWEMNVKSVLAYSLPDYNSRRSDIYLARHVFQRCQHSENPPASDAILIGWRMVASHRCTTHIQEEQMHHRVLRIKVPCRFRYNSAASRAAGRLVTLAGLEIGSATGEDMDARNARFVVNARTMFGRCTEGEGYPILSWRAAVAAMYSLQSEECRLATDEEESLAKENEPGLREAVRAWACNHCNRFLESDDAQTKPFIVQHLREEHEILTPQLTEGVDFFVDDRCRHAYEATSYIFKHQPQ